VGRILTVTYTWARRCVVALIGGTVVLVGIVMIVTPGPAFVVIPAGLGILSIEFAFARRWLKRLKKTGTDVVGRTRVWMRPSRSELTVARPPASKPLAGEPAAGEALPGKSGNRARL
jgi:Putative transmembrane protein (PGPGW)